MGFQMFSPAFNPRSPFFLFETESWGPLSLQRLERCFFCLILKQVSLAGGWKACLKNSQHQNLPLKIRSCCWYHNLFLNFSSHFLGFGNMFPSIKSCVPPLSGPFWLLTWLSKKTSPRLLADFFTTATGFGNSCEPGNSVALLQLWGYDGSSRDEEVVWTFSWKKYHL